MFSSRLIIGGNQQKRIALVFQLAEKKGLKPPHPDFLLLEGGNSIGIKEIKKLQKKIAFQPYSAKMKIVFIPEAEKLTLAAQNALLKTLEEPPARTLIILSSPQESLLLPTIISRCQVIKLPFEPTDLSKKSKPRFFSLTSKRIGERLKIAKEYSQNKEKAIEFIKEQLFLGRIELHQNSSLKLIQNLHLFLKTSLMLQANVNPHLALGNLFLNLS